MRIRPRHVELVSGVDLRPGTVGEPYIDVVDNVVIVTDGSGTAFFVTSGNKS